MMDITIIKGGCAINTKAIHAGQGVYIAMVKQSYKGRQKGKAIQLVKWALISPHS